MAAMLVKRRSGRAAVLSWLLLALVFATVAVCLTWPLTTQLSDGIPLGTEAVATVPLFNLWTLGWNVEGLRRAAGADWGDGWDGYWQAPIFHPTPNAFARSEPLLVGGLIATAIVGLGGSLVLAYNLILLGALTTNGLLATGVLRTAGLGWLPSVTGGLLVQLLPFTHQELGVLHLVAVGGLALVALGVLRFADSPRLRDGLLIGVGLAVAYGLGGQVTVFGVLAGAPAIAWLWWPHRASRRAWLSLGLAAAVCVVTIAPLALTQGQVGAEEGLERSAKTIRAQSARPGHYVSTAWPALFASPGISTADKPSARAFWPGSSRVLLALLACIVAWRLPAWRRKAVAGALLLASSVLLSLGGNLGIGDLSVASVVGWLPGLGQVRSFFRFALFAQLAVVGLAALALEVVGNLVHQRLGRRIAIGTTVALAVLAIFELRPPMSPVQALPPLATQLPWVDWIDRHTEADDVLAFVPFPEGRSAGDYLGTSQWMYWQMRHWRPMVNGYSGFFPASFRRLKKLMPTFPDQASLAALHTAGVRYCIVHRAFIEQAPAPDPAGRYRLVPRFQDEQHGLAIFALRDHEGAP